MRNYLFFFLLLGCASYPEYAGRYFERKIGKELHSTRYTGDSRTAIEVTSLYSAFRAIEYCSEMAQPVPILIEQSADGKAVDTIYLCAEKSQMLNLHVRTFSEIKLLTKDGKGGVEVAFVPKDSPNQEFRNGDFLVAINGARIENVMQMTEVVNRLPSKGEATIYRNGNELKVNLTTVDNTNQHLARNKEVIRRACDFPELGKRPLCRPDTNHQ